jgi:hypothetical protein
MPRNLAQTITAYIPFGIPLITILIALPLVLKKVPPNLWYGFRTRRTLSDPDIWYRANYLGGLGLLYAGVASLAVNLALSMLFPSSFIMRLQAAVVVIAMLFALIVWARQMRNI